MAELSPQAQAVYDAVREICPAPADEIAAAALQAAADQVSHRWDGLGCVDQIIAIAAELEGAK